MVTSAQSIGLMRGQLSYLVNCGYDVTVISSSGKRLQEAAEKDKINIKAIEMKRTISPFKDLLALLRLIFFFMKLKPDVCNAGTPKAGLLGMIAAKITRVPFKVYTNRGVAYEGSAGFKKRILLITEKITCFCANKIICIAPSIKKQLLKNNLAKRNKTIVFGKGSSNGLQLERFIYNEEVKIEIERIKQKYQLYKYEFIIGSVGRINNFKGIKETVLAFENLQYKYNNICLLLIGAQEEKDSISMELRNKIIENPNIIEIGRVENPVPYYYIMDILSFPTYREGFGNVSIEAQATGTPVVTTNATGSIDTVIHNETGYIIDVKDVKALQSTIEHFMKNPKMKEIMGQNAEKWVVENFDSNYIWNNLNKLYADN